MSTFYIVATPIGNLGDISLRAIETLAQVPIILVEDTRRFAKLRSHLQGTIPNYHIHARIQRFDEHTEQLVVPLILNWLDEGKDIALVSDAGTPLISDPGYMLVHTLLNQRNHTVTSIPGPSSVINALILSGLPTHTFMFLGYLPPKSGQVQKTIKQTQDISILRQTTFIAFETPHRILKTVEVFKEFEEKNISLVILQEMTKMFETRISGTFENILDHLQKTNIKGEFVLVWRFGK